MEAERLDVTGYDKTPVKEALETAARRNFNGRGGGKRCLPRVVPPQHRAHSISLLAYQLGLTAAAFKEAQNAAVNKNTKPSVHPGFASISTNIALSATA